MPDNTAEPQGDPFIGRDLRPDTRPADDSNGVPPTAPAARSDIERRVSELLGGALGERLGVGAAAGREYDPRQAFSTSPDVVFTEVDGDAVLLNLQNGLYYSLNRVGTAIWNHLSAGKTMNDALEAILGRFNVARENAWRDLNAMARDLCRTKLLQEKPLDASHGPA